MQNRRAQLHNVQCIVWHTIHKDISRRVILNPLLRLWKNITVYKFKLKLNSGTNGTL